MFEINGYEWYLKFVEPYSIELQRDDGSYTVGMCNNTTKKRKSQHFHRKNQQKPK